ncbi:phosphate signaling complex protein PhoU [Limnochorda pilosa]|uniref:Phosphate-specific transport system accessory protein PhoU n=1 Tax=Limnochorda pilosa TaxID=1555112 RepID=A0A0K2SMX2_LIMPI|nr:phosphate signaling complex protein PhoU [Limnochorda pilosa]BAS28483.1 PhoU family transcriptional regulator [Limnochorda pilosa]
MPREAYENELQRLKEELLKMGGLVEELTALATRSLADQDEETARRVIRLDDVIDRMDDEIEERCMRLIALQQPLARDLRLIGGILKVVTDLERIADYGVNIAEITLRIAQEPLIKPLIDIPRMAAMAQEMTRHSLDSLVRQDVRLAEEVCHADDPVDELYSSLFDELIGFVLEGGEARRATQAINLIFVARYLERIADHATNIAERVIYIVTGERVPHQLKGHYTGTPGANPAFRRRQEG